MGLEGQAMRLMRSAASVFRVGVGVLVFIRAIDVLSTWELSRLYEEGDEG